MTLAAMVVPLGAQQAASTSWRLLARELADAVAQGNRSAVETMLRDRPIAELAGAIQLEPALVGLVDRLAELRRPDLAHLWAAEPEQRLGRTLPFRAMPELLVARLAQCHDGDAERQQILHCAAGADPYRLYVLESEGTPEERRAATTLSLAVLLQTYRMHYGSPPSWLAATASLHLMPSEWPEGLEFPGPPAQRARAWIDDALRVSSANGNDHEATRRFEQALRIEPESRLQVLGLARDSYDPKVALRVMACFHSALDAFGSPPVLLDDPRASDCVAALLRHSDPQVAGEAAHLALELARTGAATEGLTREIARRALPLLDGDHRGLRSAPHRPGPDFDYGPSSFTGPATPEAALVLAFACGDSSDVGERMSRWIGAALGQPQPDLSFLATCAGVVGTRLQPSVADRLAEVLLPSVQRGMNDRYRNDLALFVPPLLACLPDRSLPGWLELLDHGNTRSGWVQFSRTFAVTTTTQRYAELLGNPQPGGLPSLSESAPEQLFQALRGGEGVDRLCQAWDVLRSVRGWQQRPLQDRFRLAWLAAPLDPAAAPSVARLLALPLQLTVAELLHLLPPHWETRRSWLEVVEGHLAAVPLPAPADELPALRAFAASSVPSVAIAATRRLLGCHAIAPLDLDPFLDEWVACDGAVACAALRLATDLGYESRALTAAAPRDPEAARLAAAYRASPRGAAAVRDPSAALVHTLELACGRADWDTALTFQTISATADASPAVRRAAFFALLSRHPWPGSRLVHAARFDPDPSVRAVLPPLLP